MLAADLAFAGLARQAELVRDGAVSSRELTELYLERIGRLDPQIRAYRVVLAEEALAAADAADRRRGPDAPPLNGVPIAIKDDTDVAGQVTAHGSLAHTVPAEHDAEIVARLRAAGTVILGGEWLGLPAPIMLNAMANFTAHLAIWNHTGQPAAALPVEAAADGFPVGVQLVARPGDEATLLALAAELETATGWLDRRPPLAA